MPVLCLVPTPLAAARAARRLCDAQAGILFGPSISTLERLAPGLLAAAADRRAILPPLGERLLAAEAGRAVGGALAAAAPDSGLADALARAIAELRRGEVTPAAAREAAARLEGGAAARLAALAGALEAYEAALGRLDVLDRAGAARAAADAARRGARSAETDALDLLVVDGIAAASPAEWDLLAALAARARRTRFHVPWFADRPDASSPAEPLLRRIEALHDVAARRELEVVLPHAAGDGRAARPAALLSVLGGGRVAPTGVDGGGGEVLAAAGAGEAGEAEAIARVLARLAERGIPPGEIVVVAPAARRLAPALARACGAAGIPVSVGRGARLADAPVVRAVLDALAAAGGLDRSSAERLATSSYLSPPGVPGALGPLLDRSGALDGRGPPQAALRARAEALTAPSAQREREALRRAADALDALAAGLRPLAGSATAREQAARLAAVVDGGVRRRAARAPRDVAARDLGALAALGEAVDGLVRAVALVGRGEDRLPADAWRALVALAVGEAALPPAPEPVAGAVELWGLEEAVRRAAVATSAARRADASFRAFCAAAAGREAVAFTWAAPGPAGDGGPLAPVVSDALALLGVPVPAGPPADPPLAAARTAREALRAVARGGPAAARALAGSPLAPRAAAVLARGGLERARRAAVRARRAAPHAGAPGLRGIAALRAALPAEWSPTQLEKYARCPFRLFLDVGAGLEEPSADGLDIDVRDEGSLLHAILEAFVRARVDRGAWPPAGGEADRADARAIALDVLARFEREGRTGDPAVWAARREAVLARLDRVVAAEARDADGLVPVLLEHGFGGRSGRAPLEVSARGATVRLRGRIDRVDAGPDRLVVLDYKNAKASRGAAYEELLDPESFGRTSFQIPAYLLAAARELPGRPRLLATYALLRSAERLEPVEVRAGDLSSSAAAAPSEASFADGVVDVVARVERGEFPIASRSCERCPFGAVCRFEGVAAAGAEEDLSSGADAREGAA